MANNTFILIRNAKSSIRYKKNLFKHLINSNSLVVKYIIIIIIINFQYNKGLFISFWFEWFKTLTPEREIVILIYISLITTL